MLPRFRSSKLSSFRNGTAELGNLCLANFYFGILYRMPYKIDLLKFRFHQFICTPLIFPIYYWWKMKTDKTLQKTPPKNKNKKLPIPPQNKYKQKPRHRNTHAHWWNTHKSHTKRELWYCHTLWPHWACFFARFYQHRRGYDKGVCVCVCVQTHWLVLFIFLLPFSSYDLSEAWNEACLNEDIFLDLESFLIHSEWKEGGACCRAKLWHSKIMEWWDNLLISLCDFGHIKQGIWYPSHQTLTMQLLC